MNKCVTVIIDCISRFLLLYPSTTTNSAPSAFLDWIGLFGSLNEILSDNSKQYVNNIKKEFMYVMSTEQTLTRAYSKRNLGTRK